MSDKYCPAGQIPCEHYEKDGNFCLAPVSELDMEAHPLQVCAWPGLQKPIQGSFEEAWKIFDKDWFNAGSSPGRNYVKSVFFKSLKRTGFKDE